MIPRDLTEREYALNILEETLGFPRKSNLDLLIDCLEALGKAKRLTPYQSFIYMNRAIGLARKQGVEVDHLFFLNGAYMTIRPERGERPSDYRPVSEDEYRAIRADRAEFFASGEYKQFLERMKAKGM